MGSFGGRQLRRAAGSHVSQRPLPRLRLHLAQPSLDGAALGLG
jgi:hypothetical protein